MTFQTGALAICGCIVLGACATPLPPTLSAADVTARTASLDQYAAAPDASTGMPTGKVSYVGTLASNPDDFEKVFGDLTLTADFDSDKITGNVKNMNYIEGNKPDQTLRGTLTINGTRTDELVNATARGTLSGAESGFKASGDFRLTLDGSFRSETTEWDSVAGSVNGKSTGGLLEVDVTDGVFYAVQK